MPHVTQAREQFMRTYVIAGALVVGILLAGALYSQGEERQPPCASSEARQFDFWIGSWTVYADDKIAGHNRISSIHSGCTLLEEYEAASTSYEGKSFNYYDPGDARWHQVWVDNSGLRLHLSGTFADGKMVMSGERNARGGKVLDRITWSAGEDGTVRQVWETSEDDGASWKGVFDGRYVRDE